MQYAPSGAGVRTQCKRLTVAPDGTHHLADNHPAYGARFEEVLKFHSPGLAPVRDASGAYHIKPSGQAAYPERYVRTFGFYERRAAVQAEDGWFHIRTSGKPLSAERYAWCGNFQGSRCTVRRFDGLYLHIQPNGKPAYQECYRYAGDYRDGMAVVQGENGLHTHVNLCGESVHGHWLLDLDIFHKGYARARDREGWHHIDLQGRPIYARRFAAVEPFYNGQARVEDFDGSLLVIDQSGVMILRLRNPL